MMQTVYNYRIRYDINEQYFSGKNQTHLPNCGGKYFEELLFIICHAKASRNAKTTEKVDTVALVLKKIHLIYLVEVGKHGKHCDKHVMKNNNFIREQVHKT